MCFPKDWLAVDHLQPVGRFLFRGIDKLAYHTIQDWKAYLSSLDGCSRLSMILTYHTYDQTKKKNQFRGYHSVFFFVDRPSRVIKIARHRDGSVSVADRGFTVCISAAIGCAKMLACPAFTTIVWWTCYSTRLRDLISSTDGHIPIIHCRYWHSHGSVALTLLRLYGCTGATPTTPKI